MPPQTKFPKTDTIEAAFNIVRRHGWEKLSARSIAAELGSSTMPIYSNLKSMGDLEEVIVKKALDLQLSFEKTPRTGDPILDLGLGYVLFAKHERHLFKAINDEKHGQLQVKLGEENFEFAVQALSKDPRSEGMSRDQLREMVFFWWIFVHGLANINNDLAGREFNNLAGREFNEAEIADCIRKAGALIMKGFLVDAQDPEKTELE
jgi:AcrR family transcriptional regulator